MYVFKVLAKVCFIRLQNKIITCLSEDLWSEFSNSANSLRRPTRDSLESLVERIDFSPTDEHLKIPVMETLVELINFFLPHMM